VKRKSRRPWYRPLRDRLWRPDYQIVPRSQRECGCPTAITACSHWGPWYVSLTLPSDRQRFREAAGWQQRGTEVVCPCGQTWLENLLPLSRVIGPGIPILMLDRRGRPLHNCACDHRAPGTFLVRGIGAVTALTQGEAMESDEAAWSVFKRACGILTKLPYDADDDWSELATRIDLYEATRLQGFLEEATVRVGMSIGKEKEA